MKRTIYFCFAILIIMMIWSCGTPGSEKANLENVVSEKVNQEKVNQEKVTQKKVNVISIVELGLQGLLQKPPSDLKLQKALLDEIKRVRYFEIALQNKIASDQPQMAYLYSYGDCCPCDSSGTSKSSAFKAASLDLCCPCPSSLKVSQDGLDIVSLSDWNAVVVMKSTSTKEATSTSLDSKKENKFQFFSLKEVKDGNYEMIIKGGFTTKPISLNVNIQGGKLNYKL